MIHHRDPRAGSEGDQTNAARTPPASSNGQTRRAACCFAPEIPAMRKDCTPRDADQTSTRVFRTIQHAARVRLYAAAIAYRRRIRDAPSQDRGVESCRALPLVDAVAKGNLPRTNREDLFASSSEEHRRVERAVDVDPTGDAIVSLPVPPTNTSSPAPPSNRSLPARPNN